MRKRWKACRFPRPSPTPATDPPATGPRQTQALTLRQHLSDRSSRGPSPAAPISAPSSNVVGGQTGLIHISEIAYEYVRDVRDLLKLNDAERGADPGFEEKLSKVGRSSEERLLDLKRNLESKGGGRFK